MIELHNITLAFGERTLIAESSALFERGSLIALLGRNGTGKSTLLRAIASLGSTTAGCITIDGTRADEISAAMLAKKIAFVNTERVDVDALSVHDLVAIGRAPYTDWMGHITSDDESIIERSMSITGITAMAERRVDTLSDGECQRVMIARALAQDTPAILLDEPTSFLDLPNRYELCTLLRRLAHEEHKLVIFSTHELDIALALADSIALVDTPRLVHMPTAEMIASGNIERLFDSDHVTFDAATGAIKLRCR
ncbi:MAG: ABC transporter ATP-binding protein [Alistipes sp.]|nr:ABC transporter ATP-binding protein [Alistipes sp.]